MLHNGIELISIFEFVGLSCKASSNEFVSELCNEFCSIVTSKYSFGGNFCFKAEAFDKTRHLLFSIDLILKIFVSENIKKYIIAENFLNSIDCIISKKYSIVSPICCCCPKKLKKAIAHTISFTEFVRNGEAELRRFNALKPSIRYLICLDIEAYEHSLDKLLEFGLSVFDLELCKTTNTHIIISDYIYFRNGRFVADNRHKFNFGQSQYLSLELAIKYVISVLSSPSSCLVGHNIKSDVRFLKGASDQKIELPIFDTQIMYKQFTLNEQYLSLVKVLDELCITHSNLHNAGNDAYYTLEVFKKISKIEFE